MTLSLYLENLIAFESKFKITYYKRSWSSLTVISFSGRTSSNSMPNIRAWLLRISTTSTKVLFRGWTSKFGAKKPLSSMFLSKVSLTWERRILDVDTISLASLINLGFLLIYYMLSANSIMHFRGVSISWLTLDVRILSILLSAESFANLSICVMSRTVKTLHYFAL